MNEEAIRQRHAEELAHVREEAARQARAEAAEQIAHFEEERVAAHKREQEVSDARRASIRVVPPPQDETQPISLELVPEVDEPQAVAPPVVVVPALPEVEVAAPAPKSESLSAPVASTTPRRTSEMAGRSGGKKKITPIRMAPPPLATSTPPALKQKKTRISVRERVALAGRTVSHSLSKVPWQAWRTLGGIVVLALAWMLIARACNRQPEVRATRVLSTPLTQPWVAAPEPYLD